MIHCIYILKSEKTGKFYIGQAKNLAERLNRHNQGRVPSTKSGRPWRIIYKEDYTKRVEAIKRENYLKSLKNKKYINEKIINRRRGVEQ